MYDLPTVKIQDGDDYAVINQRDFNPSIHQIYKPRTKLKRKKQVPEDDANSELNQDNEDDANSELNQDNSDNN